MEALSWYVDLIGQIALALSLSAIAVAVVIVAGFIWLLRGGMVEDQPGCGLPGPFEGVE